MKSLSFNDEMIRAILEGRKNATSRPINPQPKVIHAIHNDGSITTERIFRKGDQRMHCPYGRIGHTVFAKEAFFYEWPDEDPPEDMKKCNIIYRASEPEYFEYLEPEEKGIYHWSQSTHMPVWASRIKLHIESIKVQRLHDITELECQQEGAIKMASFTENGEYLGHHLGTYKIGFEYLWESLYGKTQFQWKNNPWRWFITFKPEVKNVLS